MSYLSTFGIIFVFMTTLGPFIITCLKEFDLASKAMMNNQLGKAIDHYTDAIRNNKGKDESTACTAYFLRGNLYKALNRLSSAIEDYSHVIKCKPSTELYINLARIYIKKGLLDQALEYLLPIKDKQEASNVIKEINNLKTTYEKLTNSISRADYRTCLSISETLRTTITHGVTLLNDKILCLDKLNLKEKIIAERKNLFNIHPNDTENLYDLSMIYKSLCDLSSSLEFLRKCLRIDQDHQKCHKEYSKMKKYDKFFSKCSEATESKNMNEFITNKNILLELASKNNENLSCLDFELNILHCIISGKTKQKTDDTIKICSDVINKNNGSLKHSNSIQFIKVLLSRSRAYIENEELDKARVDVRSILSLDKTDQEARSMDEEITRLQKIASKRNYYKILGVAKNAKKSEISKAYRKLALKWHPDKFSNDEEKAKAEKMLTDINDSREVLEDKEKRKIYDSGYDPLDHDDMEKYQRENAFSMGGGRFPHGRGFSHGGGGGNSYFNFGNFGDHFTFHF